MPQNQRSRVPGALSGSTGVLACGEVEIQGRMPWSSNATFLVTVDRPGGDGQAGEAPLAAIYKPAAGERPLWDFPGGLYRREIAAYELSEALGWALVPETVARDDAPLGSGSLQRFVDADFEQHYFTLLEEDRFHPTLKRMAVFDVVANNADRKGGHCLLDTAGHIWGIDHGLCFHTDPKLRTVIWDFAGERLEDSDAADLAGLLERGLPERLTACLHQGEAAALEQRISRLLRVGRLPEPRSDRPYPWPLV
ncbi:MAG TPA: SCO1664 family protein [Acidimicrobiales bacterium]|nr:SCO1664 family protein [Acidimicrobiales bacterium]